MAPWWWFLREPKHVGATVGIFNCFSIPVILWLCASLWNNKSAFDTVDARYKHEDYQQSCWIGLVLLALGRYNWLVFIFILLLLGGGGGIYTGIEGAEENTRTAEEVMEAEDGCIMQVFTICIRQWMLLRNELRDCGTHDSGVGVGGCLQNL
jgi:hypothetical protein